MARAETVGAWATGDLRTRLVGPELRDNVGRAPQPRAITGHANDG